MAYSSTPESLLATNRWPERLKTLGTRLITAVNVYWGILRIGVKTVLKLKLSTFTQTPNTSKAHTGRYHVIFLKRELTMLRCSDVVFKTHLACEQAPKCGRGEKEKSVSSPCIPLGSQFTG